VAYEIEEVLADDLITIIERDDESGHYALRFGELETVVSIQLGRSRTTERTHYKISHAIHTPVQIGPYKTSLAFSDYWAAALDKAVTGITVHFREAVEAGYDPKESWLVKY